MALRDKWLYVPIARGEQFQVGVACLVLLWVSGALAVRFGLL